MRAPQATANTPEAASASMKGQTPQHVPSSVWNGKYACNEDELAIQSQLLTRQAHGGLVHLVEREPGKGYREGAAAG